jgi:hypothetical protein
LRSAEKCGKTKTGFDPSGVKLDMIGVETGADNLQLADFNWTKEWGANLGKADNESGASRFISEPGCDAVLHQRRHNKDQNNEREQNKTERKQRFFS